MWVLLPHLRKRPLPQCHVFSSTHLKCGSALVLFFDSSHSIFFTSRAHCRTRAYSSKTMGYIFSKRALASLFARAFAAARTFPPPLPAHTNATLPSRRSSALIESTSCRGGAV